MFGCKQPLNRPNKKPLPKKRLLFDKRTALTISLAKR